MGNKNYSKFSEHFNKNENNIIETIEEKNAEVLEEVINEAVVNTEENTNLQEEDSVEVNTNETLNGVVSGCERLNMRKEANKGSDVITILVKNEKVTINTAESTEDFYKICTASGDEGYCMKTYITIK